MARPKSGRYAGPCRPRSRQWRPPRDSVGGVRVARRRRTEAHVAATAVFDGEAKSSDDRSGVVLGGHGLEPLAALVPTVGPLAVALVADDRDREARRLLNGENAASSISFCVVGMLAPIAVISRTDK